MTCIRFIDDIYHICNFLPTGRNPLNFSRVKVIFLLTEDRGGGYNGRWFWIGEPE